MRFISRGNYVKKITEEEIKKKLNIKDWKHFKNKGKKITELVNLLQVASPETVKEILSQLPELKETSKEILNTSQNLYNNIIKENTKTTSYVLRNYQSQINFLQDFINKHDNLTFDEQKLLIDKISELLTDMKEIEIKNKSFLNVMANNWGIITLFTGAIVGGWTLLVGSEKGKEAIKFFADNIKKIKGNTDSEDLNLTDDIIDDKNV